ncbi:hypothetical protein H8L32_00740 [Undibacterium sp. CY18W]|uniref:Uncharacterized protein n=1 Tax=Undibacterium hunanense TaxID=2762292 RepID=A0ABR6ZJD2_9BURK|nr:hypothetical protein [Undibacterium hunanense]MBC3915997.1 hypothetical protein [Undibacterium hunanense]
MLKFFASSISVYIHAGYLKLAYKPGAWHRSKKQTLLHQHQYASGANAQINLANMSEAWGKAFNGMPKKSAFLHLTIADELLKYFIVLPPANAKSLQDYMAVANMRFETLFGLPGDDWQMNADWQLASPSLVCAIPKALQIAISDSARIHRQHVLSLQPRFVRIWNDCRAQLLAGDWFATIFDQNVVLAMINEGRLQAIKVLTLPLDNAQDWMCAQIQRESISHQLPMPGQLKLAGDIPSNWKCVDSSISKTWPIATLVLPKTEISPLKVKEPAHLQARAAS